MSTCWFKILLSCFILLLTGCSFSPNELKIAEKVIVTAPDSALNILKNMKSFSLLSESDRAMYGLLYFRALDQSNKKLTPDSLISFSVKYYQSKNDKNLFSQACYYKAKEYKDAQLFDQATEYYLKSLDIAQSNKNYLLLGNIYADLGYICGLQQDFNESLNKYKLSVEYFKHANRPREASYRTIDIGKTYRFTKQYTKALKYYRIALDQTRDSLVRGLAYQEMGNNFYWAKKYDSAFHYLSLSLKYPYENYNYAIRCFSLADLYFDIQKYDSSFRYANLALNYPANFFTQRECYRLLANTEYVKGNFKQMAVYMSKYQVCTDSVRRIETQTKSTILEDLHLTSEKVNRTKKYLFALSFILPVLLIIGLFIYYRLRKKNQESKVLLGTAAEQLEHNQDILVKNIKQKIKKDKDLNTSKNRGLNFSEKEKLEKEIYLQNLNIEKWDEFRFDMNNVFNQIVTFLEKEYSDISRKEIIWCCLFLLDVPTQTMLLILEIQTTSLYKLKQRFAQKLNLNSTKELEKFLLEHSRTHLPKN